MKVILKNSEILFKTKNYQELSTVSVLNSPTSFYVNSTGSKVSYGASGGGIRLYVNVYQVTAGTTYYIKSTVVQSGHSTIEKVGISFGTNLLNSSGDIFDYILLKTISLSTVTPFNVEFTPSQNGYIYITELDYREEQTPTACLSSVFE